MSVPSKKGGALTVIFYETQSSIILIQVSNVQESSFFSARKREKWKKKDKYKRNYASSYLVFAYTETLQSINASLV